MTQQLTERAPEELDELGPVDWIVVEFPGSRFKGEIAPILDDLVERGMSGGLPGTALDTGAIRTSGPVPADAQSA